MWRFATPLLILALPGCFIGDEDDFATREQIIEAAKRCGIDDFQPYEAGAAWAAYVVASVPDAERKEDCIYADLDRQGLVATR